MAEYSMLWQTNTTGDGAVAGYTEAQTLGLFERMFASNKSLQGVLIGWEYSLYYTAVSDPAAPYVTVKPGAAIIYGLHYWNTANKNLGLALPIVGDTGFRIVLQAIGGITKTVRLAMLQNIDGVAAIPALTQDAGFPTSGTWEIPLYTGVVDMSGDIWTDAGKTTPGLTDERAVCRANMAASPVVYRQGGTISDWITPGTNNYRTRANKMQVGSFKATASVTPSQTETITFPETYLTAPLVLIQAYNGNGLLLFDVQATSTTDFDVLIVSADGSNILVDPEFTWIAVGGVA